MELVNLTPHTVRLTDGREFAPSGQVARVATWHELTRWLNDGPDGVVELDDEFYSESIPLYRVERGSVEGLPAPVQGTMYIVSSIVLAASGRHDLIAPATGHPAVIRRDGQVWAVPGFIRN